VPICHETFTLPAKEGRDQVLDSRRSGASICLGTPLRGVADMSSPAGAGARAAERHSSAPDPVEIASARAPDRRGRRLNMSVAPGPVCEAVDDASRVEDLQVEVRPLASAALFANIARSLSASSAFLSSAFALLMTSRARWGFAIDNFSTARDRRHADPSTFILVLSSSANRRRWRRRPMTLLTSTRRRRVSAP